MMNDWWNGAEISAAVTQAKVILLHKKGDKNNLSNYRPISLLNTNYNIFTAIIQQTPCRRLGSTFASNAIRIPKEDGHCACITLCKKDRRKKLTHAKQYIICIIRWGESIRQRITRQDTRNVKHNERTRQNRERHHRIIQNTDIQN